MTITPCIYLRISKYLLQAKKKHVSHSCDTCAYILRKTGLEADEKHSKNGLKWGFFEMSELSNRYILGTLFQVHYLEKNLTFYPVRIIPYFLIICQNVF